MENKKTDTLLNVSVKLLKPFQAKWEISCVYGIRTHGFQLMRLAR